MIAYVFGFQMFDYFWLPAVIVPFSTNSSRRARMVSYSFTNAGMREDIKEGMKEGKMEERMTSIRELMKNLHFTAEQAMSALGIPEAEHAKYAGKLF